jgi:hypothetical protein
LDYDSRGSTNYYEYYSGLACGAADPPVAGPVIWRDSDLEWASGPELSLGAGEGYWHTSPTDLPDGPFTIEVQARISDPGAAWGIWLEAGDGTRIIYAINGAGYTTTRRCPADDLGDLLEIERCPALRPEWRWMEFPRIHRPGESNRITLHTEAPGMVRLRLNEERMGIMPVEVTGRWGVWGHSGRESGAGIRWEWAVIHGWAG